jgi:ribonuclease HI
MNNHKEIYVDGSYNSKLDTIGYGIVVLKGSLPPVKYKGRVVDESLLEFRNVAGEVMAVYNALEICNNGDKVTIYYDYEGIEKWAIGEWKANNKLTKWYQNQMQIAYEKFDLRFIKVTAHTGNKWNEEADRLAKEGCELL